MVTITFPEATYRRGITLIQFLVVFAIFGFLLSWLLSTIQKLREAAARTQTLDNLRHMGMTTHAFHDKNRYLPPAFGPFGPGDKNPAFSLSVHLLPYIEQDELFTRIKQRGVDRVGRPIVNSYIADKDPLLFLGKKDGGFVQNFAGNIRIFSDNGFSFGSSGNTPQAVPLKYLNGTGKASINQRFLDGTSNVIMFATRYAFNMPDVKDPDCSQMFANVTDANGAFFGMNIAKLKAFSSSNPNVTFQMAPSLGKVNCGPSGIPHSFSNAGIGVCLGDATTRILSPGISVSTWNNAITPNDGQALDPNWSNE